MIENNTNTTGKVHKQTRKGAMVADMMALTRIASVFQTGTCARSSEVSGVMGVSDIFRLWYFIL